MPSIDRSAGGSINHQRTRAALQQRLKNLRVMLVEDSAFVRKLVRSLLTGIGINNVRECADGDRALACIGAFEPEIILLDWEMPKLNGPQFVSFLGTHESFSSMLARIIILTSYADRTKVAYAKANGLGGFVSKPFSASVLRDHIVSVLAKQSVAMPPVLEEQLPALAYID